MYPVPLMKSPSPYPRTITHLADRIQSDIRRRDLSEGDRYLNASEAAKRFRVSTNSANRALQLLAKRRVVTRKQRAGTFIHRGLSGDTALNTIGRVHLLVHERYLKEEGVLTDGVLLGIQSALPGATIEFNFIPPDNEKEFIGQLIHGADQSDVAHAFVLVRASLLCQRMIADAGYPAVIHGTPYPCIHPINSLDRDWDQAAVLAVDYLTKAKCCQFLILSREVSSPGLHRSIDAISKQLELSGVKQTSVVLRSLYADAELVAAEIDEVLSLSPGKKLGVIGLSEPLCEAALSHLRSLDSTKPGYSVVSAIHYKRTGRSEPDYPYLMPVSSAEQMGEDIGRILLEARPHGPRSTSRRYPMRLVCPD